MARFSVLGPLEVKTDDDRCIDIPRQKLRSVFVILLMNGDKIISTDRISRLLWGQDAPQGRTHAVHSYISSLRSIVAECCRLTNARPGYRVSVEPGELDVHEFRRLYSEGLREFQKGDVVRALGTLQRACDVWRDISLPDFPAPMAGMAAQLTEEFYSAEDSQIDILLALDRHREAIPILSARTIEHPGHERSWTQLMLALYRSDRRAQALATFAGARQALIAESGIEPGPTMNRLHRQIFRDDPALDLRSIIPSSKESEPFPSWLCSA